MDTRINTLGENRFGSPLRLSSARGQGLGHFVPDAARVRYNTTVDCPWQSDEDASFEMAGPREKIFFDPKQTRAAIVTCGGICPGINNVIRSAFFELHYNYGVQEVLGIRYGYAGMNPAVAEPPLVLTRDMVDHLQDEGGSFLGTSRGPQPTDVMVQYLIDSKINVLICVGGDGTLRGAKAVADEAMRRGAKIAIVGVPKTIDNDVDFVQRTFGVSTATDRAGEILDCAHTEARSVYNGIGLVKVMGREAGFIACLATLASQEVNLTLIPEVPFELEGENGILTFLRERLERRHHALVVVAEGAGQHLVDEGPKGTDKSGNKRLADIGPFLKERIQEYFKRVAVPVDVKYLDPSYYIRSVPATSDDAVLCDQLARDAVHAAMAGKTGALVSFWHGSFMLVPIALATAKKKQVDPEGVLWTSVLAATGQPCHAQNRKLVTTGS